MGVDGGDDVEEASDDHELGAVVGSSEFDRGLSPARDAREDVKETVAEIADELQHVEQFAGIGPVDLALERDADREHRDDRDEQQRAANPLLLKKMACAGDEPAG